MIFKLNVSLSSSTNPNTILQILYDALICLNILRQDFNLLLSHAASYMVATGKTLNQLYPNLFQLFVLLN